MDEDLKPLFSALTKLQKGVCLGILEGKVHAKAYYEAGGLAKNDESANAIVSRMLTDANVKAFMEAAEGKAITSAIATKEQVLKRLSQIALGNVSDLVEFRTVELTSDSGEKVKQSVWHLKNGDELTEEQAAMISELSAGKDGFKFKTHSSTQAAKELAAMLGWNAPQKVANTDTEGKDIDLLKVARSMLFTLELASEQQDSNSNKQNGE